MSSFVEKIKAKVNHRKSPSGDNHASVSPPSAPREEEQRFNILPHPAKTNDPADLQPTQPGGGLRSNPAHGVHHAHGPQILSEETKAQLPPPLTHQEAQVEAAALRR